MEIYNLRGGQNQYQQECPTLKAKGTDAEVHHPCYSFAGEHKYEIEARNKLEGEVSAGIVLYYNSQFFMGSGFNRRTDSATAQGSPQLRE